MEELGIGGSIPCTGRGEIGGLRAFRMMTFCPIVTPAVMPIIVPLAREDRLRSLAILTVAGPISLNVTQSLLLGFYGDIVKTKVQQESEETTNS